MDLTHETRERLLTRLGEITHELHALEVRKLMLDATLQKLLAALHARRQAVTDSQDVPIDVLASQSLLGEPGGFLDGKE